MADALERDRVSPGDGADTRVVNVAWDPGPEGWVTLNSDGLVDYSAGIAAAGGLLRDSEGRCLLAYSMNLGACSITRAEMRGAIEGLQRVWNAGHRRVILKLDSRAAIALLTNGGETMNQHAMETLRFQELQDRDWTLMIQHAYREGDRAADF
ncbi:Putative ribonuclease H protein At1g65750 [Linum perenne]